MEDLQVNILYEYSCLLDFYLPETKCNDNEDVGGVPIRYAYSCE